MFLNSETDYAIRLMNSLAKSKDKTDAKTLAAMTGVTPKFTLKILHRLGSSGLAVSYKGKNGGYALSRLPEQISLLDIVEVMSGSIEVSRCQGIEHCTNPQGNCRLREVFNDVSEYMVKKFSEITLNDLG